MNIKQLIAATSILIIAGSVFAQSINPPETSLDNSAYLAKTRAQVKAELVQARAQGLMDFNDLNSPITPVTKNTKTRVQVKAELIQARAQGHVD